MSKFSSQHYNAIAKDIREEMAKTVEILRARSGVSEKAARDQAMSAMTALCNMALRLARRFVSDNPEFDPILFLDRCSPNQDLYPLSELWEEDEESRVIQVEG